MNADDTDDIRQWLHELNEETDGPMYARVLAVVNEQAEMIEQLRARVVELEGCTASATPKTNALLAARDLLLSALDDDSTRRLAVQIAITTITLATEEGAA